MTTIVFTKVLCHKQLNLCIKKDVVWKDPYRRGGLLLDEQDKIELLDFVEQHGSAMGIESFFVQNGLLEDKLTIITLVCTRNFV